MKIYITTAIFLFMTSCASIDLFNKKSDVITITTTVGDELIDLQKALDSGAITQDEDNQMKEKILQRD